MLWKIWPDTFFMRHYKIISWKWNCINQCNSFIRVQRHYKLVTFLQKYMSNANEKIVLSSLNFQIRQRNNLINQKRNEISRARQVMMAFALLTFSCFRYSNFHFANNMCSSAIFIFLLLSMKRKLFKMLSRHISLKIIFSFNRH